MWAYDRTDVDKFLDTSHEARIEDASTAVPPDRVRTLCGCLPSSGFSPDRRTAFHWPGRQNVISRVTSSTSIQATQAAGGRPSSTGGGVHTPPPISTAATLDVAFHEERADVPRAGAGRKMVRVALTGYALAPCRTPRLRGAPRAVRERSAAAQYETGATYVQLSSSAGVYTTEFWPLRQS
jgi:hypothetical protein